MASTTIPGVRAKHTIITENCRNLHGNSGLGAFDEAVKRIREEYANCLKGWQESERQPNYHLVLTVERPTE